MFIYQCIAIVLFVFLSAAAAASEELDSSPDIEVGYYFYYYHYTPPPPPTTAPAQVAFLEDLYESLNGDQWDWTIETGAQWVFSSGVSPCASGWVGVTCVSGCADGSVDCEIASITLNSMNLVGNLSNVSSFPDMSSLISFDIASNSIEGQLPETIGCLTALSVLDVSTNSFTGNIPQGLSALISLQSFSVDFNKFKKELPDIFSSMPSLQLVYASNNMFTGPLPPSLFLPNSTVTDIELCYNFFSSTLPTNIGYMKSVQTLELFNNCLSGSIPAQVGSLTALQNSFSLDSNRFTGVVPSTISYLTQLTALVLSTNSISQLPQELSSMTTLVSLSVDDNALTAGLPSTLGDMTWLLFLNASANSLTEFPSFLGDMVGLQTLLVSENNFAGQIPDVFGSLQALKNLALVGNSLTGDLPNSLYALTKLSFLGIGSNDFTGTISSTLGEFPLLEVLGIADNLFTGAIPTALCEIRVLSQLSVQNNFLSNTIPTCLGNLTTMEHLYLDNNRITGSIPANFDGLVNMASLNINNNELTGALPAELGSLVNLQALYASSNLLTGTISDGIGSAYNLTAFVVNDNFIEGTLPTILATLSRLSLIQMNDNLLTGALPVLNTLPLLETLLLYNNNLSGGLADAFSINQTQLNLIDVANNNFNGKIPGALFELPNLRTLSAVSNCFTGSLPSEMCGASQLQSLDFDGLNGGSACIQQQFAFLTSVTGAKPVYTSTYLTGSIPQCLFDLPAIEVIHLSGNGISGELPEVPTGSGISDISMGYNRLDGTIPESIQRLDSLTYLDLSHNYLSGTCDYMTNYDLTTGDNATTLYLDSNRLSGNIPAQFQDAVSINVLTGNLFECNWMQSDLPVNDPEANKYSCGTHVLYVSLSAVIFALVVGVVIVFVVSSHQASKQGRDRTSTGPYSMKSVSAGSSVSSRFSALFVPVTSLAQTVRESVAQRPFANTMDSAPQTKLLMYVLQATRGISGSVTVVTLCVLLPLYLLLKLTSTQYSTHTYNYGWVMSVAFLKGPVPAALVMIFWCILLFGLYVAIVEVEALRSLTKESSSDDRGTFSVRGTLAMIIGTDGDADTGVAEEEAQLSNWRVVSWRSVFAYCINFVVVVIANAIYVYVSLTQNDAMALVSLIGLVIFKVGWNLRVVPILLANWCDVDFWRSDIYGSTASSGLSSGSSKGSGMAHSLLLMFNNVVAPCLATAAADSSCFLNFFIGPAPLVTTFAYPQCVVYSLTSCVETEEVSVTTDFNPPFIYSYQCTSAILTRYVPMFLLMYSFTGIVLPVVHSLARIYLGQLTPEGKTFDGSTMDRTITDRDGPTSVYLQVKKVEKYTMGIVSGMHWPVQHIMSDDQRVALVQYKIKSITCNVMGSFAVLLTFGLCFPPLALVIMLSVFSSTKVLRRAVHEHVTNCPKEHFSFLCKSLEREAYGLSTILRRCAIALLLHSSIFLFFVMIDIDQSLALAICAVLLPFLMSAMYMYRVEIALFLGYVWDTSRTAWPEKSDTSLTDGSFTSNPIWSASEGGEGIGGGENVHTSSVNPGGTEKVIGGQFAGNDPLSNYGYQDEDEDVLFGEERCSSMRMSNYRNSTVVVNAKNGGDDSL